MDKELVQAIYNGQTEYNGMDLTQAVAYAQQAEALNHTPNYIDHADVCEACEGAEADGGCRYAAADEYAFWHFDNK